MRLLFVISIFLLSLLSCKKSDSTPPPSTSDTAMYFPENTGNTWENIEPSILSWNTTALNDLDDYLSSTNTKAFIILVNGRIAYEKYFNGHEQSDEWEWNSAGKSLLSATVGIAQHDGLFNIHQKASDFLGLNWTNMSLEKENLITLQHLLSMTSGIDDAKHLVKKSNLNYTADAGTRWAYGNVFQVLMDAIANASHKEFEYYFNENLKEKIGMDGYWNEGFIFTIYHSTARSMARFGLLFLNKGKWKNEQIVPLEYFHESTNSSQTINPAYGYLWWLNGKSKYMIPGSQEVFDGKLVPNAPDDMFAAMGAKDQRVYIIPSKNMVVVRMGKASNPSHPSFAVSGFDNTLWEKLNAVFGE